MKQQLQNIAASLADLGIILPLMLGTAIATGINAGIALIGLGLFALASGLIYRRPIPAQPMKVVAALAIVGQLDAPAMAATGILLGIALLALGAFGLAGRLKRLVPGTVLYGIQIALAISLAMSSLPLLGANPLPGLGLLLVFVLLKRSGYQAIAFLGVLTASLLLYGNLPATPADTPAWTLALPTLVLPNLEAFATAAQHALLPQLALTLTNALFLTAVIAQEYYPDDNSRLTENRFALTSGAFNLLLAPFGAVPMCHGAGGLVAYHAAGGRSGLPVVALGLGLVAVGIATGPAAVRYLALVPEPTFGILLLITATYLADPKKLLKVSPTCRVIIGLVVAAAVFHSMLAGLAAGIVLESIRSRAGERFATRGG
jgi:hypothetical protein